MRIEVTMPNLGSEMQEGTMQSRLKRIGDGIERGEPLAEVETHKTTVEMEAMTSATFIEILCEAGSTAAVGSVIALIESEPR